MKKICGIYSIKNVINNKIYIGSSAGIYQRWTNHKRLLKYNTHHNKHLQGAYDKYGENNFKFYIIEECEEKKLLERENFWIAHFKCLDRNFGYNFM